MDCKQTSASTWDFDEMLDVFENPSKYEGKYYQKGQYDSSMEEKCYGSHNISQKSAHGASPSSDIQMSLGIQEPTLMEILCGEDKPFQSVFQASNPVKPTPDIDLSLPHLSPDVIQHLEELPTKDDKTKPACQPPAKISNGFNPLPPQIFPIPTMPHQHPLPPHGFPVPTMPHQHPLPPHCFHTATMPFQGLLPAQCPLASPSIPGPALIIPTIASLQQMPKPDRKYTRAVRKPIPSELKDEKYNERRKLNTLAARRSRDKRKQRVEELAIHTRRLQEEEVSLEEEQRVKIQRVRDLCILCGEEPDEMLRKVHMWADYAVNLQSVKNDSWTRSPSVTV
ncbi:hypothetical protein C0Q70_12870 [Pomacea canaliculata]|uniref:BZIP domain-containing protein n=1 Tax=Pomacea canaliculata TaxID=400727 RepID=A0A2T7P2P8_POMCA|nr:hypothetical protein C0Q70_12870 [Pomacea canaliculata]